jgi:hypothetical protein
MAEDGLIHKNSRICSGPPPTSRAIPMMQIFLFLHTDAEGSGLATWVYNGRARSPYESGKTAMRRLIKPLITFLLLIAISMAVVDPALAETRTARNDAAVIEYQIDGKGPRC